MKFVIAHSHFRPGGVRRVIELALPHLALRLRPRLTEVILAGGEAPEPAWHQLLVRSILPVPVTLAIDPALGYLAEQSLPPAAVRHQARSFLERLLRDFGPRDAIVWSHNPGLGRNLPATAEWTRACERRGIPLVLHHHDWWFDNRWQRWPELRRSGAGSLRAVARRLLPAASTVRHAAINQADARPLRRHFPGRAAWLPNPASAAPRPSPVRAVAARQWLSRQLGTPAPVWLLPCRLLRRKNIAEALLLTRWLNPHAHLVTTGGVSSSDEQPYAEALAGAARLHAWPLHLSVLHTAPAGAPSVPDLLAASETVVLTSLIEGFGLPFLEAAAARRPLLARHLPNIAPDLARFGLHFPDTYPETLVDPGLLDWPREYRRQDQRFARWRSALPPAARAIAGLPAVLAEGAVPRPVPFSRLTLAAQLEVLAIAPADSLRRCLPLNPWLARHTRADSPAQLCATTWPATADRWLGGDAYARRLLRLARSHSGSGSGSSPRAGSAPMPMPDPASPDRAQADLLRTRLAAGNLYPLLWTPEP